MLIVVVQVDNLGLLLQHLPLIDLLLLAFNGPLIEVELELSVDLLVLGQHLNLAEHLETDLLRAVLALPRFGGHVLNAMNEKPLHKLRSLNAAFILVVAVVVVREVLVAEQVRARVLLKRVFGC